MNAQGRSMRAALVVWILMTVAAGWATAADTDDAGLSTADRDFVAKAAQGGLMEVAAGKLAAQRALDPAVKAFGQKMVTDHTAANDKLKSLANSKQALLPDAVSQDENDSLAKLEALVGADFDKAYSKMMIQDHTEDISEFEKEVKEGRDPDIKSFAQSTLPTLRHHLMLANRLGSQAKKSP